MIYDLLYIVGSLIKIFFTRFLKKLYKIRFFWIFFKTCACRTWASTSCCDKTKEVNLNYAYFLAFASHSQLSGMMVIITK
jgi:hypothetical protein